MSFLFRYLRFHDIIGGIHVPVDDGVDKLNRKYTLLVFLFLALPIFTKQYIGDPIECFAPVYFAEHQARYINSYCWTQSTYYMVSVGDPEDDGDQQDPPDRITPDEVDYFVGFETVTNIGNERLRRVRVSYYQWAPLILLVQGLCFYIPFLIWNSCANNAGVKLRRLLKKASDIASLPPGCQQREALLAEFVDQFHTLVTGEAGWCADLQCNPAGSNPGSSASSLSSGSANSQQQTRPGQGAVGSNARQTSQQQAQNDHQEHQAEGRHRNHQHSSHQQQPTGCCLVSIPIIGSLLACCLKPCLSFGLVGPSKYLSLLYLAVKFAYVFNVALQFFLLGQFLGRGYLKHGLELINRLFLNGEWWASPRFPLSTLCQVRADMSGGLRSYTCQCVLPINVFNEKIFSVVWFYMAFLMPLNVLSLLFWVYRTFESNRLSYIRLCLWRTRLVELNQIHRTVRKLSQSYLGWDGVFLLRLIEHNHGSIMATLIMSRLWEFYANQMKLQEDANMIAMANNAQHTLSNTTTAISNQHQLLAAAAAAAANQIGPGPGGGGGGHHPPAGGHHGPHQPHTHVPLQPLMPAVAHGGAGHPNHAPNNHAHGPHSHPHVAPFGGGGGGHGLPLMSMQQQQQHGPHAHHTGQISSQASHHPLHAANTLHTHPTHLSSSFGGANANLLAQLQQQQQHHHPTQGQPKLGQAHPNNNSNQVPASGNVAAAVATLAAAAANSTNQSASGQSQAGAQAAGSSANNQAGNEQQQKANMHQHPNLNNFHLHSLMQPSLTQQQSSLAATSAASSSSSQNNTSQQANTSQQQAGSQQTTTIQQQAAAASSGQAKLNSSQGPSQASNQAGAGTSSTSGQQQQQTNPATTSFITSASVGQQQQQAALAGPPLPPPPPAHVVAAVAAAANSSNSTSLSATQSAQTPGAASVVASGTNNLVRTSNGSQATRGGVATSTQQQQLNGSMLQPAPPPPHINPLLFNLKSSNNSNVDNNQSTTNTNQPTSGPSSRYTGYTIKR